MGGDSTTESSVLSRALWEKRGPAVYCGLIGMSLVQRKYRCSTAVYLLSDAQGRAKESQDPFQIKELRIYFLINNFSSPIPEL